MSDRLEQCLREHYEAQQLSRETVERLSGIIEQQRRGVGGRWARRKWLAVAASLVVVLTAALLIQVRGAAERRIRLDIARQAARDHNLRLDVEVPATTYAELRNRMSNVDFSPVEPAEFAPMGMRLIGARFGSLQGQPAVQIKLADPKGEICTLIQARPVDKLAAIEDRSTHQIDGLLVDVWREKGLLMVLARPMA